MKKVLFSFIMLTLATPSLSLANNTDTSVCNTNYPAPVVSATENDNGITLSWDKINHDNLIGYKIVISKEDETPIYPDNGYLQYITDRNITSYQVDNAVAYHNGDFGYYLKSGEDYYFSVTALYGCSGTRPNVAGNVIHLSYHGASSVKDDSDDDSKTDNQTNTADYPTPVVTVSSSEDGVLLSWDKISDDRFTGYKIVVAKNTNNPKYPDHGYARYITDPNTTSYLLNNTSEYVRGDFGGYLKPGEDYYFSVTALYGNARVAGNSVEAIYNGPSHQVKVKVSEDSLSVIEKKARELLGSDLGAILDELQQLRDKVREQENEIKYLRSLMSDVQSIAQSVKDTLNQFITYGVDENTEKLGEGERAAVIHSYKSAFNKLPETEDEVADAIKIANGRWPSKTSEEAEAKAREEFRRVYLRDADMNNPNDNAAVTVMAYGLRQKASNRNLDSERQGIKTFQYIYGHTPSNTEEWNIMQAITYSGATR